MQPEKQEHEEEVPEPEAQSSGNDVSPEVPEAQRTGKTWLVIGVAKTRQLEYPVLQQSLQGARTDAAISLGRTVRGLRR